MINLEAYSVLARLFTSSTLPALSILETLLTIARLLRHVTIPLSYSSSF
jgi:hypothetical protein